MQSKITEGMRIMELENFISEIIVFTLMFTFVNCVHFYNLSKQTSIFLTDPKYRTKWIILYFGNLLTFIGIYSVFYISNLNMISGIFIGLTFSFIYMYKIGQREAKQRKFLLKDEKRMPNAEK